MSEKNNTNKLGFGQWILKAVRHLFLHNGWVKLFALLLSLVLWAGLISQDETLTREKTFNNVTVNVTGEEALKNNRKIVVTDTSELLKDVSFTVAVPQKVYDNAEASIYNVRLDLSKINGTGRQEVKLLSTGSSTYGNVISITPSKIDVEVEEYTTKYRVPVSVNPTGDVPDGWYMSQIIPDITLVVVSGPKSLVSNISRGRVSLDTSEIEWKEGSFSIPKDLKLYNRQGEEIDDPLLEITYDGLPAESVILDATLLPTKTFGVKSLIKTENTPARGYEVKDVRVTPEYITVAAKQDFLDQMQDLALETHTVSVKGLRETKSFDINISKPTDAVVLPSETITVTVEIGPVESE